MTEQESESFRSLSQAENNRIVKELCALTNGAFVWEDRIGPDGRTYTAFGAPAHGIGAGGTVGAKAKKAH